MSFGNINEEVTARSMLEGLVVRVRDAREDAGLSRRELSERTGIPAPTIKHFEDTGQISLERLLLIAETVGYLEEFGQLFLPASKQAEKRFGSLEELERAMGVESQKKMRRRGR